MYSFYKPATSVRIVGEDDEDTMCQMDDLTRRTMHALDHLLNDTREAVLDRLLTKHGALFAHIREGRVHTKRMPAGLPNRRDENGHVKQVSRDETETTAIHRLLAFTLCQSQFRGSQKPETWALRLRFGWEPWECLAIADLLSVAIGVLDTDRQQHQIVAQETEELRQTWLSMAVEGGE